MADARGRFFWGIVVGGVVGYLLGTYLSTEQGRQQLDTLKARTVELTGDTDQIRQRATAAATTVTAAVGDALQEGISAARQKRQELGAQTASGPAGAEDA